MLQKCSVCLGGGFWLRKRYLTKVALLCFKYGIEEWVGISYPQKFYAVEFCKAGSPKHKISSKKIRCVREKCGSSNLTPDSGTWNVGGNVQAFP